jgi:hypothetical protein
MRANLVGSPVKGTPRRHSDRDQEVSVADVERRSSNGRTIVNLEVLNTAGVLLTAAIIAATAVAAVIQLRHIRASNELAAFNEAMELWYLPSVQEGFRFIQNDLAERMKDADFRADLDTAGVVDHTKHPELGPVDFFDNLGVMVSLKLLREEVILHPASQLIQNLWETLSLTIAIMRRKRGRQLYVSFEYLAARARLWQERYPEGLQVTGWERLPNPDIWSSR